MRESLHNLVKSTIIYKYDLPNAVQSIPRTLFSTENDKCYSIANEQALVEVIYNSIIDYSFNEFDFTKRELDDLHTIAFQERVRFNEADNEASKLKYGFFGEVLLHCVLKLFFKTDTLISKGYFYDPLTKGEARGYDAYHLIEENHTVGLWFGETKFHINYTSAVNDVLKKIKSSLSDDYLSTNLLAIRKNRENLNIKGSKIETILNDWDENPSIKIIEELKQHSINLIYPVIILFQQNKTGYDDSIKKIPKYIEDNYQLENYDLSIPYSVFFIFIPIEDVKKIKKRSIRMDRIEEATNLIKALNTYRNDELEDYEFIKIVCSYFDKIKQEDLSGADLSFLKYISNIIGIPHFYDLLEKFEQDVTINSFDLNTLSAVIYESTLNISKHNKVHKYQKQILELFKPNQLNRYFLSASTSFGKTHIVFEIIKQMDYDNVVLIFPTIALLTENLERLTSDESYNFFVKKYSIHTLSEVENIDDKNLFIYTPERFLSFVEKRENEIKFNFAFIDEVYKIDNDYIIDEEVRENERDVAYRLAVFYSLKKDVDTLLAGPYIDFSKPDDENYNRSFDRFLENNEIKLIDYNNYEIVNKTYSDIKGKKSYEVDHNLDLTFEKSSKNDRLIEILQQIFNINENTIIYCYSRSSAESYAKTIINSELLNEHSYEEYAEFINHISDNYNKDWTVINALKKGIGIHHGLVPKYIQRETVSLFNKGLLKVLLSTTTITEGVNTSAKNLIVLHNKKGNKPLKKFDAKNIAGRAGRFFHHYNGRVIVLKNNFMQAINSEPEGIKHKNYDIESPKEEIDLFYTEDEYLTEEDKAKIIDINQLQEDRGIPDEIFHLYKVVSRKDKIEIYDKITLLNEAQLEAIKKLIRDINYKMDIDNGGFQVVLGTIESVVKNQKLKFLIQESDRNKEYSLLTHFVHFYLKDGFKGSVQYKISQGEPVDKAISKTAEFVYNTLKYQVVKYLGVFNIMYKFYISQQTGQLIDEVSGLDRLLTKLEYNAFTEKGRIASDFGVPTSIIDYYENEEKANEIKNLFDNYELTIFEKVEKIINEENTGGNSV